MSETTVYEGVEEGKDTLLPQRRTPTHWVDRVKVLVILAIFFAILVSYHADPPFVTWGEAFSIASSLVFGVILLTLMGLEIIRQLHYLIAERWARYNHFWSHRVFGGAERQTQKRMSEWTRYRIARLFKIFIVVTIYAYGVMIIVDDVESPIDAILRTPQLLLSVLPFLIYGIFIMSIVVMQFVAIFWFLSRGGIDVVFPEDIETRFDSVWGQDHVLALVRENVAFLEKPDEIEAKGGYIPGGILLWGPPGTGKTLMAEGIAGETGKPFVFVDPGAFIQMFMGVGILKVKRLFRKLRKLSLQHGGVIVFFDEADSLGSRGQVATGSGPFQPYTSEIRLECNGLSYLSPLTQQNLLQMYGSEWEKTTTGDPDQPRRGAINRIIMGAGMGGGGMGTLQALLTEISGLKKPRGLSNRVRRLFGFKPKPPPKYRILIMMATNMPNALDEALLRPGRIDRIYKVGYPSKDGRRVTLDGYLAKVQHDLTDEQIEQLAVMTPYYSGAKIKDLVNEALILAIRDDRVVVSYEDMWRAKSLKELGPPEDAEYIIRERHAVAVHEASHAVVAHLLRTHMAIDLVTIERRGNVGGMVKNLQVEDRFTQWRTELETDVKVALASLAGERMFFGGDNSSGVSSDLQGATQLVALMEGIWGMGDRITSHLGIPQTSIWQSPDPTGNIVAAMNERLESKLTELYDEVYALLEENRDQVLALARVLEERKTISGDDVAEVMGTSPGSWTEHQPEGFGAVDPEDHEPAAEAALATPGDGEANGPVEDETLPEGKRAPVAAASEQIAVSEPEGEAAS